MSNEENFQDSLKKEVRLKGNWVKLLFPGKLFTREIQDTSWKTISTKKIVLLVQSKYIEIRFVYTNNQLEDIMEETST